MTHRKLGSFLLLAALTVAPAYAGSAKADYSVRNDTGRRIDCMAKVAGSSQTERLAIKAGQTWSGRFSASKGVRFRCEGAYSVWTRLAAGRVYAAVEPEKGVIRIRAAS